jgi:acetoin utilization deacetylase AcuC-like enzyme
LKETGVFSVVYSDQYDLKWAEHVFPVDKFRRVKDRIIRDGIVKPEEIIPARRASESEVLLVHLEEYYQRIWRMTERPESGWYEFEAPVTEKVIESVLWHTGGSIVACEKALEGGVAVSLGGGFHHAFPDHGEGFCFINDIAVAVRAMLEGKKIQRCAIIDCDLHQGNGTARIFEDASEVFTFSIHQENLYPIKQKSDIDVGLPDFAGDDEYLPLLQRYVPEILDEHKPDLVFYVAGADPYRNDKLGTLQLTKSGLKKRDEIIFGESRKRKMAVVAVLAGGYAADTEDVIDIHAAMVACAARFAE